MTLGRYSRIDNRRQSSNYCSTVMIVVFVALCLVGVWMMTSSSVVLDQKVDVSVEDNKKEVKEKVSESNQGNTKPFEDNNGDLPEDATKGDNTPSTEENLQEENPTEKDVGKPEKKPEEKTLEKPYGKFEQDNNSDDGLKSSTQAGESSNDDMNSETRDGDTNSGAGDSKPGGQGDSNEGEKKPGTDDTSSETQDRDTNSGAGGSKPDGQGGSDEVEKKPGTDDTGSDTRDGDTNLGAGDSNPDGQGDSDEWEKSPGTDETDSKADVDSSETKPDNNPGEMKDNGTKGGVIEEKLDQKEKEEGSSDGQANNQSSGEVFPLGAQSELLNESATQSGSWSTQAAESKSERESQLSTDEKKEYNWKLCNSTAGPDYIPCLDNLQAIKSLRSTKHYEHRERHCPEEPPTCLVPLPEGYRRLNEWPQSREKIWYYNVPHTKLAEVKGHQNWVKVSGEYLTFPGGGTQFKHGALHYIDFINQSVPDIAWGKRTRVILDVGCGVASFGGYLFDRDVLTMSFAPKDEHEAQVQFALERGIPALSAVMGTKRLPFPGQIFDAVHCARCRVPWHFEGGKLLLELNRVLRPGGYFIWSATPLYRKLSEDVEIWKAMKELTKAMCWETVSITKDRVNGVGIATYRKPTSNDCYEKRSVQEPPMCEGSDELNAAWNVPLQACMHKIPVDPLKRGSQWPRQWPVRLDKAPYWLLNSQVGIYGKPEPEDFASDYEHWKRVVSKSYLSGFGINWAFVRNVMDMRSIYGGFAAALRDMSVWVMNVVPADSPDTLPIIYERGLFGIYHDWCESFSTYPRSYDLLHADHLFSTIKKKCNLVAVVAEVDRILRPEGKLIVRDDVETIAELEYMLRSMQWEVRMTYSKDREGLLCVQKSMWRPQESETITYAIA